MKNYNWSVTRRCAELLYEYRMEWVLQAICDAVAKHWLVEREPMTFWQVQRQNATHVLVVATDGGVGDQQPKILYLHHFRKDSPETLDKFRLYVQSTLDVDDECVRVVMLPEDY